MPTSNTNQSFNPGDPVWVLLAELSFSDFLSDQNPREETLTRFLFPSLRELGIPPECMENIARVLAGFTKLARAHYKQSRLEFPGRMRIFCQKKRIEEVSSAEPSTTSQAEPCEEQKHMFPVSGVGGWGYFTIARIEALPPDSSAVPHSCTDLYLYKEGG